MSDVTQHYERFPYPPIPWPALPRRGQGAAVRWEHGSTLAFGEASSHAGKRILVVGGGTLEPLVVSLANPRANEVVALDLSARSLRTLKARVRLARVRQWVMGLGVLNRVSPMRFINGDAESWEGGHFDYILASNVLHHHPAPASLFQRLSTWLKPRGLMRVVTYPASSRFWLRYTSAWLKAGGVSPSSSTLVREAAKRVAELPSEHPIRLSFESNVERLTATGIADAYFHPCERPLRPTQWAAAARDAGLELIAEDQHELSRSTLVDQVCPRLEGVERWSKLQLLDDLHELSVNPVMWFRFQSSHFEPTPMRSTPQEPPQKKPQTGVGLSTATTPRDLADQVLAGTAPELWLPSAMYREMGEGIARIDQILEGTEVTLEDVFERFTSEVGPHYAADDANKVLPGMTVHEYPLESLRGAPKPWQAEHFARLESYLGDGWSLMRRGERVAGEGLPQQVTHLQLSLGASRPWIGPLSFFRAGEGDVG